MVLDAPALNSDQLERLAANVRRRLEEIGDPAVRIPVPEDYRVEHHTSRNPDDYFYYDLAVDIDIGSTVITLRRRKEPRPCYGAVDVDALARSIVMHVLLATSDRMAITALTAAQSAVRAKIKRDGSSLAILSVRYEPEEITTPKILSGRRIWVDVGLLDNCLRPTTETVTGRSIREICGHLRRLGDKHRERLATLERITPYAGVLELDGLAEHAIAAAGRDVGEIAKAILAAEPVEPALEVVLSRDEDIGHFGVRVRDGRIVLEAHLGHCWIGREGLLGVQQGFPESVLIAIPGRKMGDLIAHPLLNPDMRIGALHAACIRPAISNWCRASAAGSRLQPPSSQWVGRTGRFCRNASPRGGGLNHPNPMNSSSDPMHSHSKCSDGNDEAILSNSRSGKECLVSNRKDQLPGPGSSSR